MSASSSTQPKGQSQLLIHASRIKHTGQLALQGPDSQVLPWYIMDFSRLHPHTLTGSAPCHDMSLFCAPVSTSWTVSTAHSCTSRGGLLCLAAKQPFHWQPWLTNTVHINLPVNFLFPSTTLKTRSIPENIDAIGRHKFHKRLPWPAPVS